MSFLRKMMALSVVGLLLVCFGCDRCGCKCAPDNKSGQNETWSMTAELTEKTIFSKKLGEGEWRLHYEYDSESDEGWINKTIENEHIDPAIQNVSLQLQVKPSEDGIVITLEAFSDVKRKNKLEGSITKKIKYIMDEKTGDFILALPVSDVKLEPITFSVNDISLTCSGIILDIDTIDIFDEGKSLRVYGIICGILERGYWTWSQNIPNVGMIELGKPIEWDWEEDLSENNLGFIIFRKN